MTLLKKNTCAAGNSRRSAAYALREKANSDQSVGAEIALVVKSIKAMSLFGYKARAASQDSQPGCATSAPQLILVLPWLERPVV